ncbi:RHS repeat domain-containing protein, partial [Chryseobacterium sp. WLY505]
FAYDLNGNILNLVRTQGLLPGSTEAMVIDNLIYSYTGNRLTKVSDAYLNSLGYPVGGNEIGYDDNGNMTTQLDKGISSIQYNYLNLPRKITQNSKVTDYIYRADGVKQKKVFGTETTDYLDGFQYVNSTLKFFPTTEGYFNVETGKYVYNYTDHLGNVRVSYNKNGAGLEIIEESNYYPFGLKHEGYNALVGNPSYKYKYNGKELQESGMYDYGARFYMPDIGRWGVVDPKSELGRRWSPYTYALDNPIRFIDPDGMWPYPVITRSFAPFESFGGWFGGDNRGFSTSQSVTSRLSHSYVMNTDNHTYTNYGATSSPSTHFLFGSATATDDRGTITNAVYSSNKDGSTTTSWTSTMAGHNPLVPGSPDIDVKTNFSLTENKDAGTLGVSVTQTGDGFPSAETMIGDTAGNQLMIGVSPAVGNPYTSLPGDGSKPMMSNNFTVTMDKNGVFTGVQKGDKTYSVGDWNKTMTSQPAVERVPIPEPGSLEFEMVR